MKKNKIKIGIIGGSGFYNFAGASEIESLEIDTPWGKPSASIQVVEIQNQQVAFLARHGKGHFFTPTDVPYKANLAAMKSLGVEQIFAFSAVGSLKEELMPMDFVLIDQIIDRTKLRDASYFSQGMVGHISFADPFCAKNSHLVVKAAQNAGLKMHTNETSVCMEGPAFSTRAESHLYRSWGAGVINMTVLPEAKLAREAGICYNTICMVTDYDCWRETEEVVTTEKVIYYLSQNSQNAQKLVLEIMKLVQTRPCECQTDVLTSFMTEPAKRDNNVVKKIAFLHPSILDSH